MKSIFFLLGFILLSNGFKSQQLSFSAKTGDSEMDLYLKDINTKALADPEQFKISASTSFNIGKTKIDLMLTNMAPGDVYMALQLASSTGKPVDEVVSAYTKNKGKGWGVIAKEMGIKPGSPEFHAMKKAMKNKKENGNSGNKGNSGGHGNGKGKKK
ncbi:MAG: hypothetical protein ACJ76F_08395 [Bacteroidia bacterium]